MITSLRQILFARRADLRQRWRMLLSVEAGNGSLTHPETLTHFISGAIGELLFASRWAMRRRTGRAPSYAVLYLAGEQAVAESVIHAGARGARRSPGQADALASLLAGFRIRAHNDVTAFCGVCVRRGRGMCPLRSTTPRLQFVELPVQDPVLAAPAA